MSSRNRRNASRQQLWAEIEALRAVNERLHAQAEELQLAHEELRTQSEELQVQSLQLQETGQRLRLALEAADMGRWEWDLRTDAVSWCERSRALFDLDPATAPSTESFLRCVHPDDREAMFEARSTPTWTRSRLFCTAPPRSCCST